MVFLDLFKKKKEKKEDLIKKEYIEKEHNCCFDKVDYQFETAFENYCRMFGKNADDPDSLNEDEFDKIYQYAGNHIGFFMAWIIKHNFEGEIFHDDPEGIEAVINETMTGTEFVLEYCDGKLWGCDVSDEIFGFVRDYYENQYLIEYSQWVIDSLGKVPLEFIGTWEDYHKFEHVIDKAYNNYLKNIN